MREKNRTLSCGLALALLVGAPVAGQDSVALTPGDSDALSPYVDPVTTRYVVDLVGLTSSWGNTFRIGPVLKASADPDPMFSTQSLGAMALSPDHELDVAPDFSDFAVWNTPGAGINAGANSQPSTVSILTFDRRFGVGFADFASGATNAVGALIGQNQDDPSRLYVTRIAGASSRASAGADDTATISLGGIDAPGRLAIRADAFNTVSASAVLGENIITIDLPLRSSAINTLINISNVNAASDPGSTVFIIDQDTVTTNTPAMATGGLAIAMNFANLYRPGGVTGSSLHIDPAVDAHRGNPSFSTLNDFGGIGTVGSLARTSGPDLTNAINVFSIDGAGTPVATRSAVLPSPISDGVFMTNLAGDADFRQYLSQESFRGANGPVALGRDALGGTPIAAAVATDPVDGEFIAVARFLQGSVDWTIAARVGSPVLDGPGGSPIGTIAAGPVATFSGPAADLNGNIYFSAILQPTIGAQRTAFFRAVNTPSGYQLERLVESGQSVPGANSGRAYTIDSLVLADSDSVASGAVFSSSVLQARFPGSLSGDPADPASFGGAVIGARIIYNNGGTPEPYDAVLFLGPDLIFDPFCLGDANGDLQVNFADITAVLSNWLATYEPGSAGPGDSNNDGIVDFTDITTTLGNWLSPCL